MANKITCFEDLSTITIPTFIAFFVLQRVLVERSGTKFILQDDWNLSRI